MKGNKKPLIELPKAQADQIAAALKRLIEDNLDVDVGQLQAAAILDQLLIDIGPLLYNKAIQDVQNFLGQRFEILQSDIWALEK